MTGEDPHDVMLAGRVTVIVVRETDYGGASLEDLGNLAILHYRGHLSPV
jgi:hypothetical protein